MKVIFLCFISFIGGLLISFLLQDSNCYIPINITNKSNEVIEIVRVEFHQSALIVENMNPNDIKTIYLPNSIESSYRVKVKFKNGKVLDGGEVYIESGNSITETVYSNTINTKIN